MGNSTRVSVGIVAHFPPPYGGMSVQAERLYRGLVGEGIRVIKIKSNNSLPHLLAAIERVKYIRTFCRLLQFIIELRKLKGVDIVHLFGASHEYFFLVVIPAILISTILKKRIIVNYRGGEADRFLAKWGFIAIPILRMVDKIVVPSGFLIETFRKYNINKLEILPNIVPIDQFYFRPRDQIKPVMIITRHLEPLYNIPCAVRAFQIVKAKYSAAELKILGAGSQEKELKKMVTKIGLENVTFYGAVPNEELSELYNESDILINSSNADNFPGSILEGFACGLVVVSTNAGGIPYMVTDGETGLLANINDHIDLARKIIFILHDPELAYRLSLKGREAAMKHSWERVKEALFDLYEISSSQAKKEN